MALAARRAQPPPYWQVLRAQLATPDDILDLFSVTSPIVPVRSMAKGMGITVREVADPSFSAMLELSRIDPKTGLELSPHAQPNPNAEYEYANPVITLSTVEGAFRQRFSIAHEIAHLMLHPLGVQYRDVDFSGGREEVEANKFAADLLMPMRMMDRFALHYKGDLEKLAKEFGVSQAAMRRRLERWMGY